jgi:membrane protein involved in colicin uptake
MQSCTSLIALLIWSSFDEHMMHLPAAAGFFH